MQVSLGVHPTGAEDRSRRGSTRLGLAFGGLLAVVAGALLWTNSSGPQSALNKGPGPTESRSSPEIQLRLAAGTEAGTESRLDMSESLGSEPDMGGTSPGTARVGVQRWFSTAGGWLPFSFSKMRTSLCNTWRRSGTHCTRSVRARCARLFDSRGPMGGP